MKLADLERHLRQHGCVFHREGGAHSIWFNPRLGGISDAGPADHLWTNQRKVRVIFRCPFRQRSVAQADHQLVDQIFTVILILFGKLRAFFGDAVIEEHVRFGAIVLQEPFRGGPGSAASVFEADSGITHEIVPKHGRVHLHALHGFVPMTRWRLQMKRAGERLDESRSGRCLAHREQRVAPAQWNVAFIRSPGPCAD